jgi:hypothetical protein
MQAIDGGACYNCSPVTSLFNANMSNREVIKAEHILADISNEVQPNCAITQALLAICPFPAA